MSLGVKHFLNCCFLCLTISWFLHSYLNVENNETENHKYSTAFTIFLVTTKVITLIGLPAMLANFLGLLVYDTFPEKVILKGSPLLAPFICVRVVTRGNFPSLVKENVLRHIRGFFDVGVKDFMVEVVTDHAINIPKNPRIREIVVPSDYTTSSNARFKSRALQYCLEDNVNILNPNDWIVHLDEETTLTENSIKGILNFVMDGKHQMGQGLVTYANGNVVNWFTTLCDSFRVSSDLGALRFQLKTFHAPFFGFKGSYVVTQFSAEQDVSFDNGPDGSVAEDCFFSMKASAKGYTFDWIEGEMHESSPFTMMDFLQQRKRWLQGILLVVHSRGIPLKHKFLLALGAYSMCFLPFTTSNLFFAIYYPVSNSIIIDYFCAFMGGVAFYMYIFGTMKSFSFHRYGFFKTLIAILATLCIFPLKTILDNVAVIWGLTTNKHKFYVVNKKIGNDRDICNV